MKQILLTLLVLFSGMTFAQESDAPAADSHRAQIKADRQAIDSSCQADAQTAGCGDTKSVKALKKCLGTYHKAHKDFKLSHDCRAAMKKLHDDHKVNH